MLDCVLNFSDNILSAIKIIDKSSKQVCLVIDDNNILLGIVTDGDIRRGILNGLSLEDSVTKIMTSKPVTVDENCGRPKSLELMNAKLIHHIPVVNKHGVLVDLHLLDDLLQKPKFDNSVVLMAGGRGERLRPFTDSCPKPMLEVNGKPILEIILQKCIDAGFSNFYISVNYLKDKIINYFDNGKKWGININYLEEESFLGTCGCLSLLPHNLGNDIIVMNGDIITDLDLDRLIRFHQKSDNLMTVCSRFHRVRIPFAVLNTHQNSIVNITEKPLYEYQVNAGVYVLNTRCLERISGGFYNMTDLIEKLLYENENVGAFPIHENWRDIGNPSEFKAIGGSSSF